MEMQEALGRISLWSQCWQLATGNIVLKAAAGKTEHGELQSLPPRVLL
jgi:hypothetical protein